MKLHKILVILTLSLLAMQLNYSTTFTNVDTEFQNSENMSPADKINQINAAEQLIDKKIVSISSSSELLSNMSLDVSLDIGTSIVGGNLTVDYRNNDLIALSRIPFHLYPSGMSYDDREGGINVLNVTDSGGSTLEYNVFSDQQLMWVNLSTSLEPDQITSFEISFETTIPDGLDRANSNGFDSNQSRVYTCSAFYPIPCVYDEYDGWNTDPYLNIGDPFYFNMANYELYLEIPSDYTVAVSGDLIDLSDNGLTALHHYKPVEPIREMVFSASRYYIVESSLVNGVNVSTFYLPHSSALWGGDSLAHNTAVNSLTLFNDSFGTYPYTTYNVVEAYGFYGGMEYPCLVLIAEAINSDHYDDPAFFLEMVIAHETGHQWWCHLVGDDQVDWGHLDEGLTSWSTDYYMDYYNPSWQYFDNANYWLLDEVRPFTKASKVNQTVYECNETDTNYRLTAYRKTPLILQQLRLTLGQDFMASLRHFFNQFKFKIATFPDLQRSFEAVTSESLDWFFFPWFDNAYLPKYGINNTEYNPETKILSVTFIDSNEEKNDHVYSQKLPVRVLDIRNFGILYNQELWINGTTTVEMTLIGDPGTIEIQSSSENCLVIAEVPLERWNVLAYSEASWFEKPTFSWIDLERDDYIEWDCEMQYTDSQGLFEPVDEQGTVVRCDILKVIPETRYVRVETDFTWSSTNALSEQFAGNWNFYVDQEGHVYPYYLVMFSPFVGSGFQFTNAWIESASDFFDVQALDLQDYSIDMDVLIDGYNNFTLKAEYNTDGLLKHLEIHFDPFYPAGLDGPVVSGYLILDLKDSSKTPVTAGISDYSMILVFALALAVLKRKWRR